MSNLLGQLTVVARFASFSRQVRPKRQGRSQELNTDEELGLCSAIESAFKAVIMLVSFIHSMVIGQQLYTK